MSCWLWLARISATVWHFATCLTMGFPTLQCCAPRKQCWDKPVPQPLVSAAAAAAGAAAGAAFGGVRTEVCPGQAAGWTTAAASWAKRSGCPQGGSSPATHQRQYGQPCASTAMRVARHRAVPEISRNKAAAFQVNHALLRQGGPAEKL